MQRKKLGWARVCVTVWECVDSLSEKSSNYDELAGYWFLDEFLSCLASIMSVIHAAPHGAAPHRPGWRLWEGEQHQEMFPNTLESWVWILYLKIQPCLLKLSRHVFCQNIQKIPPAMSCSSVFTAQQPPQAEETPLLIWTSDEIDHPNYPINTWDELCGTVQYPVHTGLHSTTNDAWIIIWEGFKIKRSHILNDPFRKSYMYHILSSYRVENI